MWLLNLEQKFTTAQCTVDQNYVQLGNKTGLSKWREIQKAFLISLNIFQTSCGQLEKKISASIFQEHRRKNEKLSLSSASREAKGTRYFCQIAHFNYCLKVLRDFPSSSIHEKLTFQL